MKFFYVASLISIFAPIVSYSMDADQAALNNQLIAISSSRNFEQALNLLQSGANPDCTDERGISPRTRILQELEQPHTPLTPQVQENFEWTQQPRIPACYAARKAVIGHELIEKHRTRRAIERELKSFLATLPESKTSNN